MAWDLREIAIGTLEAHFSGAVKWPDRAVIATIDLLEHTPTWHTHLVVWADPAGHHARWLPDLLAGPDPCTHLTWGPRIISLGRLVDHLWDTDHFRDRDLIAQIETEAASYGAWIPLDDGTLAVIDDDGEDG